MKLTCDVCGGALQMNAGAQEATCKICGMCYSIEVLRSKLAQRGISVQNTGTSLRKQETPVPPVEKTTVRSDENAFDRTTEATQSQDSGNGFRMAVDTVFAACLAGTVERGSIGIGEKLYINGDYSKAYTLRRFGNDPMKVVASANEDVRLYIVPNNKQILKQARFVTGEPVPAENAYRYVGREWEYFDTLIKERFAEYTVEKNVAWPGLKTPISYLLYKNERPVLAIFVFNSHDAKARYQAQKAERILPIGCTHFYEEYRNDSDYVVSRIREALG